MKNYMEDEMKIKIIIVSSGAIAIGRKRIGFLKKKLNLDEQQAAASVGQIYLINNLFSYKRCCKFNIITFHKNQIFLLFLFLLNY